MILPLENQVCSLESAKRFKELGVRQESLFYWHIRPKTDDWAVALGRPYPDAYTNWSPCYASAYTVAELGNFLSVKEIPTLWPMFCFDRNKWFWYKDVVQNTEAEARAKMLIYLLENKLVEVE